MKLVDIPTEEFRRIVKDLRADGWRKTEEYDGFDAWIDYGLIVLERNGVSTKFEWTNWMEGTMEGPEAVVLEIRSKYGLK